MLAELLQYVMVSRTEFLVRSEQSTIKIGENRTTHKQSPLMMVLGEVFRGVVEKSGYRCDSIVEISNLSSGRTELP